MLLCILFSKETSNLSVSFVFFPHLLMFDENFQLEEFLITDTLVPTYLSYAFNSMSRNLILTERKHEPITPDNL